MCAHAWCEEESSVRDELEGGEEARELRRVFAAMTEVRPRAKGE